jgi:hypothetical protein
MINARTEQVSTATIHPVFKNNVSSLESGGREGIRTPGLLVANEALSQLSYSPTSSNKILADDPNLAKRSRPYDLQRGKTDHAGSSAKT